MRNHAAKNRFLIALCRHRGEWVTVQDISKEEKLNLNPKTIVLYLNELAKLDLLQKIHHPRLSTGGGDEFEIPLTYSDFRRLEEAFK